MLYSSTEPLTDDSLPLDANSYLPFKLVDSTVVRRIVDELDAIGKLEEERESLSFTCFVSPHLHHSSVCISRSGDEGPLL
jgi:transcription initiation factor TFIIH subunit 3